MRLGIDLVAIDDPEERLRLAIEADQLGLQVGDRLTFTILGRPLTATLTAIYGQRRLEARFWLERGVDGFRLDTVNFYVHDQKLRDNPPLRSEEVSDKTAPSVNPYSFQNHKYDKSRPENLKFLSRLRGVMNEFQDITSVGEVGDDQRGLEIQGEYTAGNDRLHMC